MPRNTHPAPVRKHGRAQVRAQRERMVAKRWRFMKKLFSDRGAADVAFVSRYRPVPNAAELPPIVFVHPDSDDARTVALKQWPFGIPRGAYARDDPICSCGLCAEIRRRPGRRARERRELQAVVTEYWKDESDDADPGGRRP